MRALSLLALLLLAGCGEAKKIRALAQQRGAALEAKLKELRALKAAADQAPPVQTPGFRDATLTPRFPFEPGHDALVIHAERLADLRAAAPVTIEKHCSPAELAELLETGSWPGLSNVKIVASAMDGLERLRYVLVLRSRGSRPFRKLDDKRFEPALFLGDALLFDLAKKELLGGFPLVVPGGTRFTVKQRRRGPVVVGEDVATIAATNLWARGVCSIHSWMRQLLPKATPPYASTAKGGFCDRTLAELRKDLRR